LNDIFLTAKQKETLQQYGLKFSSWLKTEDGKKEIEQHRKHELDFKGKLSTDKIQNMTEKDFANLYQLSWSIRAWNDKNWITSKIIKTNGFDKIKKELILFLHGSEDIKIRYTRFRSNLSGFGLAIITEMLNMVYPDKYCLWNAVTKKTLKFLNLWIFPNKFSLNKLSGDEFMNCLNYMALIKNELKPFGVNDFIDLDIFIWQIHENILPKKLKEDTKNDDDKNSVLMDIESEKSLTQYFLLQVSKSGSKEILENHTYEHTNWKEKPRNKYHGEVKKGDILLVYFTGQSINYKMQLKKIYRVKSVSEKNRRFELIEERDLNGISLNDIKNGIKAGKLKRQVFGKLSQEGFNITKIDRSDYESILSLGNDSKVENKYNLWLVRAGDRGQEEKIALENNCVGIGYDGLPGLHLIKDFKLFKAHYMKTHPNDNLGRVGKVVPQIWNFMYEMQIGDFVILPLKTHKSKLIAVGIISGEYKFENLNSEIQQYRPVKWLKKDVDINKFDIEIIQFLNERGTVYRIGGSYEVNMVKDMLKRLGINESDLEDINNINIKSIQTNNNENKILLTLTDISKLTYFPLEILKEIESLLLDKKQIIFYGSPGTSKTFLAKNFSKYFTQDIENVRIIQFHQSYSYEDFIEGIKPKLSETGEAIGFTRQSGVFKNLVEECIQYPSKRFVLIIDEINRGNISKIFGELIYLLEYRDEKISLTYSPQEKFYIPSNLYIIGTMNSADRSIAFVDYALRRRFYFKEFYPDTNGNILDSWYKDNNITEVEPHQIVALLNEINKKISEQIGREYQIGYSYFMVKNLDKMKLKNIIDYAITPLIQQYFFGKKQKVEEIKQTWSAIVNTYSSISQTSNIQ
jgi:hypothetical protein